MPSWGKIASAGALAALAAGVTAAGANAQTPTSVLLQRGHVIQQRTTVNGFKVDKFIWLDSKRRTRTVSLKREGLGNAGHGGYAVQMTYNYFADGAWKAAVINPQDAGEGFGYFVAHERFRNFSDGDSATIAGKIFRADDSPLGRGFPVKQVNLASFTASRKAVQYRLNYPKYGTIEARPVDGNGQDSPGLPIDTSYYQLYQLPVRITWYFQSGKDFPRIKTQVGLTTVPGPDRVSFDVRGPYGAMVFDGDAGSAVSGVQWGDRYDFSTSGATLSRNSSWTWDGSNANGARYNALTVSGFEMGMVEPITLASTRTRDGYSEARGNTNATYNGGNGCPFQTQLIPCDYEWPYQSAQYSLPYNDPAANTTGKKIAWGSTSFYGMSLATVFDTPATSQPFVGFPPSKQIAYDVCVVFDWSPTADTTRRTAKARGAYNCATAELQR